MNAPIFNGKWAGLKKKSSPMDPKKIDPNSFKPKAFFRHCWTLAFGGYIWALWGWHWEKKISTRQFWCHVSLFWGWLSEFTWPFWKVEILGDFQVGIYIYIYKDHGGWITWNSQISMSWHWIPPKCLVTRPGFRQLSLHHGTHQPQHAVIIWIDAQIVSPLLLAYKTREWYV